MPTKSEGLCSVDGCERPTKARGLCDPHYKRWWRENLAKRCSIEGCEDPVSAHGLCGAHDNRRRRYGDPLATAPSLPWHDSLEGETWRPVPECPEFYEVSNLGRVRRVAEALAGGAAGGRRPYVLSPSTNPDGYLRVSLFFNGRARYRSVHRLVALAFIPRPKGKTQVNHKSGVKADNRVANLEWCSAKENVLHRFRVLGHQPLKGSRHGMAKLTADQVRAIRAAHAGGETYTALAGRYGVAVSAIHNIVNRRRWKHI